MSKSSVIVDKNSVPLGFVFGRDAFISLCTVIDEEFEKNVLDQKKAYNNPAGRAIDLIEDRLPINPEFAKDVKSSLRDAQESGWIPMEEIIRTLHV